MCVDKNSGELIYDQLLFTIKEPQYAHKFNSYASPSPVLESDAPTYTGVLPGTACIDTKTFKTLWTRPDSFATTFVDQVPSPFIYNDLLVLTMDGADVQYLVALDKDTAKPSGEQIALPTSKTWMQMENLNETEMSVNATPHLLS